MAQVRVIGFDFDGVFVLDSDAVFKKEAWARVFGAYGERYRPFLEEADSIYGSGKQGGRVEVMTHVLRRLGEPEEKIPALIETGAGLFDADVQARILAAGLVPGAHEMLEELQRQKIVMYLNSGTATKALEIAARNLKIAAFFKGIWGSTRSKLDNLRLMMEETGAHPEEFLVVGDGESDIQASREFGARFVGIANKWNRWAEVPQSFSYVTDLRDVVKFV